MIKVVLLIVFGMALGYQVGYKDASAHKEHIVTRVVERVGGSHRGQYATDYDRQMSQAER